MNIPTYDLTSSLSDKNESGKSIGNILRYGYFLTQSHLNSFVANS